MFMKKMWNLGIEVDLANLPQQQVQKPNDQISWFVSGADALQLNPCVTLKLTNGEVYVVIQNSRYA